MIVRDKILEILNFVLHEVFTLEDTFDWQKHFICSKWETPHLAPEQDAAATEEFSRGEVSQDEADQRTVHREPGVPVWRARQQLRRKQF